MIERVKASWRKNWPDARAALTGDLEGFVLSSDPAPLDGSLPVFCYHVIDPEGFRADLEFLRTNGYRTVGADALLDFVRGDGELPERSVVLTIDDGHVSLYRHGHRLLREFGAVAVAFVSPGLHRDAGEWDRRGVLEAADRPCSWEELEEMESGGHVDVQAHTHEHRFVPDWPRPAPYTGSSPELVDSLRGEPLSLREDLRRARGELTRRLDKEVRHLAFPQFDGTRGALDVAKECGYRGFWWGLVPGRTGNRRGSGADRIVRYEKKYLRRLPGKGRVPLLGTLWGSRAGTSWRTRGERSA